VSADKTDALGLFGTLSQVNPLTEKSRRPCSGTRRTP
jgi:hypothetical protein